MKKIKLMAVFLFILSNSIIAQEKLLYDFQVSTIDGEPFDLSNLKGSKVLIVNTATKCSLAPQLKRMQSLYEEYGSDEFTILAFPSNDFFNREPDPNDEIEKKMIEKYGVTFPVMAKITVKGEDIHPLYRWLTSSEENGMLDAPVKWNFQKFLVDGKGRVIDFAGPLVRPDSQRIMDWLMETTEQEMD